MMEYIVTYIFLIFNIVTCLFLFKMITKDIIKITKNNIILLLLICVISLMVRLLNRIDLNLMTNIIFLSFLFEKFYSVSIKKALYYSISISVILLFADASISMLIANSFVSNYKIFQRNFYKRSLLVFPVDILSILFSIVPFIRKGLNIFYEKFFAKIKFNKIMYLFLIAISALILTFFCLNAYNTIGKSGHLLIILGILSFTILFVITLYLMYREHQIMLVNKQIIEENSYIKKIAKQDEEFKHNLINNLLGIKTVANRKTNLLIDELIYSYQSEYKTITNINDLPNGIQSIIYRKAYQENIENLNLIVDNSISSELYEVTTPKVYNNLCTAIGILFDNALDAVKDLKEKVINIEFFEDSEFLHFVIKNSFSSLLDIENFGKKNFTTKNNGHGIGVNYILKQKNLDFKAQIVNEMFISKIKIAKRKKI